MRDGQTWQCPFCLHFQILGTHNFRTAQAGIATDRNKHGSQVVKTTAAECMNSSCREIYLRSNFGTPLQKGDTTYLTRLGETKMEFLLRPASIAKPQHETVPSPLVADYEEACAIINASPKASATLARRCLQGMIRNFCGITKDTLNAEIIELIKQLDAGDAPRQVSEESITAINAVRKIGNIGAHFEKDINLIVDVDADEAEALINLIELLFQEWYVARFDRQARLAKVTAIDGRKADARKAAKSATYKNDESKAE
jgi:hypothetical protein